MQQYSVNPQNDSFREEIQLQSMRLKIYISKLYYSRVLICDATRSCIPLRKIPSNVKYALKTWAQSKILRYIWGSMTLNKIVNSLSAVHVYKNLNSKQVLRNTSKNLVLQLNNSPQMTRSYRKRWNREQTPEFILFKILFLRIFPIFQTFSSNETHSMLFLFV